MMMPRIFGENLFDDFMNDFAFPDFTHAAQAERGDEKHRETEADDPDAAKVQKAWHKRIACSAEGSGGNDGSAEKRLGEQFDAEYLGGKRANLRVRSQNAKDERTEDHHQTSSDGHQDCAHGNADISVAFRQLVISGAVAFADERCRGELPGSPGARRYTFFRPVRFPYGPIPHRHNESR